MVGYRLEVDASIITGASSAIANLVNCVQATVWPFRISFLNRLPRPKPL